MNRFIGFHAANHRLHVIGQFFCIAKILWLHGADIMPMQGAFGRHWFSLITHKLKLP
jgi:hypothetical protein